jgi:hypothetical protein
VNVFGRALRVVVPEVVVRRQVGRKEERDGERAGAKNHQPDAQAPLKKL